MGTTQVSVFTVREPGRWTEIALTDEPSVAGLDSRVKRESKRSGRAVGAFVEDSDYAYFVAAEKGRTISSALVDPDMASNYKEGRVALQRLDPSVADQSFQGFVELVAEWKGSDPPRLDHADVRPIYAEDSVSLLSTLLDAATERPGPPSIPGSKMLLLGKKRVGKRTIDLADLRFVAGYGDGFVGVWDRYAPDEPVRRYPLSDGAQALRDAVRLSLE